MAIGTRASGAATHGGDAGLALANHEESGEQDGRDKEDGIVPARELQADDRAIIAEVPSGALQLSRETTLHRGGAAPTL